MGVVGEVGGRAASPRRDVADAVMRGAETTSYKSRDVSDAGMTLSSLLSSILCSSHHLNDGFCSRPVVCVLEELAAVEEVASM
jgi:hypothetical protein